MNAVMQYWHAGGPLMLPLFCLCVAIWYAILSTWPQLKATLARARGLQARIHGCEGSDIPGVMRDWLAEAAVGDRVAGVAQYVLDGNLSRASVHDRLEEAAGAELAVLQRHLRILRALVAAAPLVGLLGTVQGMVATFTALSAHGAVSMEMLSGGISQALITTQVGLVIALPGLVGAHAIGRRLKELRGCFDRLGLHLGAAGVRERSTQALYRETDREVLT